jgi:LysM repeat protein
MMHRILLVPLVLLLATLACTFSEDQEPTPAPPRQQPVLVVTNTPGPATSTPTLTPNSQANNGSENNGNTNTGTTCVPNNTWPVYTALPGDTLSGIAQRSGTTVDVMVAANCLSNANVISVGQGLRVPINPGPPPATDTPAPSCGYDWFFLFSQGMGDLTGNCPAPVEVTQGVGQDFEGGRVLRSEGLGVGDLGPVIYVVYNDGSWETYPDRDLTSPPPPDSPPPAGRYAPTGSIGRIWYDFPAVRAKLGWAYDPAPLPFTFRLQMPQIDWRGWPNNTAYWYIDHGKWGLVLRLFSVNMGPNRWETVGSY